MASEGNVLALVARYPRPGTVKTRLAAAMGPQPVYALYCAFLRDLAERLAGGPWRLHWLYTPEDEPFATWLGTDQPASAQQGATFNERLLNGFHALGRQHGRVIIMSSDSPQVPPELVAQGFTLLDQHDVVLGPCDDGGYYLIGMRAPHDLFTGIAMSTPTVLAETLALAQQQGSSTALLPPTFDVDDMDGLLALTGWLDRESSTELPRTRALLARSGHTLAATRV
ncbi:MAG: TIGR04282 family arsenosugar biosynthesis glycosyltransferase [Chloroflexota bacterium]